MAGLHGLLGEYVGTLSSRVLTRAHGNETEVRVAKAGAVGKRLIWSNEAKESDVFDDDVLKAFPAAIPYGTRAGIINGRLPSRQPILCGCAATISRACATLRIRSDGA